MQDIDSTVQRAGGVWLVGAGAAAVLLALFLYCADFKLTNSDREIVLEKTLRELRGAQTSLTSGAIDPRIQGN